MRRFWDARQTARIIGAKVTVVHLAQCHLSWGGLAADFSVLDSRPSEADEAASDGGG